MHWLPQRPPIMRHLSMGPDLSPHGAHHADAPCKSPCVASCAPCACMRWLQDIEEVAAKITDLEVEESKDKHTFLEQCEELQRMTL